MDYKGTTINERLFNAKLLDIWDKAIQIKDRKRAIEILLKIELDEKQADETVDAILRDPTKYGYKK